MSKLILLLKKIHYVLLFLVLETVALYFYAKNDPYKSAIVIANTAAVSGNVHAGMKTVKGYFDLNQQNQILRLENAALRQMLFDSNRYQQATVDSTIMAGREVMVLKVVKNSYTKQQNFITLVGGTNQGVRPNMALFNSVGIVGVVLQCSDNYSVATSVLNSVHFKTSGKLKNTNFTGSIVWDGKDYRKVKITELPKYANINAGDTILTTPFSNIFPDDIPIGVIADFELTNGTFYDATVELFADLSAIDFVYAVMIEDFDERNLLENSIQ